MLRYTAALALIVLSACTQSTPAPSADATSPVAEPVAEPAEPTADEFSARYTGVIKSATANTSTPEDAIQSWWSANEAMLKLDCEFDAYFVKASGPWSKARYSSFSERNKALLTGDAEASFQASIAPLVDTACVERDFDYVVQSTKPEGADKTIITALAYNLTPVPDDVALTKDQLASRSEGTRYRYTLLQTDAGWRIAKIELNSPGRGWMDMAAATRKSKADLYYFAVP